MSKTESKPPAKESPAPQFTLSGCDVTTIWRDGEVVKRDAKGVRVIASVPEILTN